LARYHSPWLPLEKRYLRGLSDSASRRAQILRNAETWKTRVQAIGHFECREGRCSFRPESDLTAARPQAKD
jgi:hypothetical protein